MSAEPSTRDELLALTAQFRSFLQHRGRSGALGVSPSAMPGRRPLAQEGVAGDVAGGAAERAQAEAETGAALGAEAAAAGGEGNPRGAAGLAMVRDELGDCQRCRLAHGRRNLVFGVGNPNAELVFVGEAPGYDEDRVGEPFVGKAGQLLTKMIEAMGFSRDSVYICNVIKCRPPQNRNPEPDEVERCEPFLIKQLAALRPRMIVALGKFAAHSLCKEKTPITRLRGHFRTYQGIQVMPTYHPAYLLRNPESKREAWADLKAVLAALERMGVHPPATQGPPEG